MPGTVLCLFAGLLPAQGQDSEPYERDLQVIATLLVGSFDNANQSYFDDRGQRALRHRRVHFDIRTHDMPALGENVVLATGYWDSDVARVAGNFLWALSADAATRSVRMRAFALTESEGGAAPSPAAITNRPHCDLRWHREAAQFRATVDGTCELPMPAELVLSDRQLWMTFGDRPAGDYQMHRARDFECYADIPGVGGGRPEPYDRHDGLRLHDQGGAAWFTSKDGRRLGISLLLVDWPINNYHGVFTRDSFVIYVSEDYDGERKEHGYAFTVPGADRIGINLKWILASCYMKSNEFETPYM